MLREDTMTAVDFMKDSLDFLHRGFRQAPEGLDDSQLHFVPEGQSHSIAWIMWHAARIEDLFINQLFQGKPAEFDTGGWADKTGLPAKGFGTGQSTEEASAVRIADLNAFEDYRETIIQQAEDFFANLRDEELTREVKLGDRTEQLGESINLHLVTHLNGHRGEINLLRGMMGFEPVMPNRGG
jgi:uncharacterized damage-inducible protein DinB